MVGAVPIRDIHERCDRNRLRGVDTNRITSVVLGNRHRRSPFNLVGRPMPEIRFVGICCATTGPALAVIDEAGRHYRYGAAVTLLGSLIR
jgi:hypothetical protein